jgi:hypothetical protein
MSRQGIEPGTPRWEASTLEKSHSNSFLIVNSEHLHYRLHISARPVKNARDNIIIHHALLFTKICYHFIAKCDISVIKNFIHLSRTLPKG